MSKRIYPSDVVFSTPSVGLYRVYAKTSSHNGDLEFDYTVKAKNEQDAYEQVFGIGSYSHKEYVDPYKDDPYLAFFRET